MSMKIRGFGHLFGRGANASEEEKDEKDEKDEKEKSKKSKRAEDEVDNSDTQDDKDKEKSKKSKGRRAEDDDDDADADEDEGDENDGDEDEDDRDVKKSRRAERDRISRILGSKYAAGKGPLAVSLAITTGMSSAAAIRVMASSGAAPVASQNRRISLDERMAKVENHQLGNSDAGGPAANSVVSRAAALYNQVKGKK